MGRHGNKTEQGLSVSTIQVLCLTLKKFFHKLLPTKKYQAKPEGEEKNNHVPKITPNPHHPFKKLMVRPLPAVKRLSYEIEEQNKFNCGLALVGLQKTRQ